MEQRVSLITLGVRDVAAARRFYELLGWQCTLDVEATALLAGGWHDRHALEP
jgi:catechol 2,3-dioxygenase-like lactoylglutathione lyase family enzyme